MKRRSWEWSLAGWRFMVTAWQVVGLGLLWHGRYNGIAVHLGPFVIDVQPPMPKWLAEQVAAKQPPAQ